MNYFDFYGIPQSFNIDQGQVKRKFYELSKLYHPDFYVNEADEKQQEILELSTLNNKAFQVLSDPNKRIKYVLEQYDLISEDDKYKLPQDFLMEMMDVNEALMELEFDPDPEALAIASKTVEVIEKDLKDKLDVLTASFDAVTDSQKNTILLDIRDLWYRQKYLLRIRESLNKFAAR